MAEPADALVRLAGQVALAMVAGRLACIGCWQTIRKGDAARSLTRFEMSRHALWLLSWASTGTTGATVMLDFDPTAGEG